MNIALVQFYPYHEEVLSPQIEFLYRDHKLFLAAPKTVFDNDYISFYNQSYQAVKFPSLLFSSSLFLPFRITSILFKYAILFKAHINHHFDIIIFNTITKKFHFKIINLLFKNTKTIHIIHNSSAFISKKESNSLSIFHSNFFLSQGIYHHFIAKTASYAPTPVNWFCPLLSGSIIENYESEKIRFDTSFINIVIPGSVDNKRRNYESLFFALVKYKNKNDITFKIYLLGKTNTDTQKKIKEMGIENIVITFTEYIAGKDMLYGIKNADAVAFLIDSKMGENFTFYNNYKVSGTTNLCLSFGTPCIVSTEYNLEKSLHNKALFYKNDKIGIVFDKIESGDLTKEYFARLKSLPLNNEYSFEYQRNQYLKAIGIT
jgi:hypothetical protein